MADAHHLRFAQSRAIGRKVSDEFTVPLCRGHHVRSIAAAMRRHGGGMRVSIPQLQPVLLFGGILILPRISQVIWIVIVMAIYVRVTLIITRKEELLEEFCPTRETNQRAAWYDTREHRIVTSDSDVTRVVDVDPTAVVGPPRCDRSPVHLPTSWVPTRSSQAAVVVRSKEQPTMPLDRIYSGKRARREQRCPYRRAPAA
jgi:hypothetical protein